MRLVSVVNAGRDCELGTRVLLATTWLSRLRGMLGRPEPEPGEGLLLTPCQSVHMYGMRFPLDVAFMDRKGVIVAAYPSLPPNSRSKWHRDAAHALELPAGTLQASGTVVGDVLTWVSQPALATGKVSRRTEAVL
jgi:uncharacterized membrane protein (UPF0127 family)